ncbi:Fe(3+)-hydroxamate ABC transporter permease FhuB [Jiella pacifica]|uniref:Fe(3+)-hydroxamate ABC transporter permease FhuB n=1 Tax=Jiella pacifica TaxID=2696469 RepID=A0A6N9T3P9_9HYPH|nr:Fe(3+)-hydroxamate ABC transporter permease FhuB [Jiella pacifica]NDW06003.1 Fe(3+)-hydroxamate ABC transporter permease FhuB [Jiella pacifica]
MSRPKSDTASPRLPVRLPGAVAAGLWLLLLLTCLAVFALAARHSLEGLAPGFAGNYLAYGLLPRGGFALLGGAALGLAGALLQRTLRNPAADASTLGVGAGAQLALGAATLFAPTLIAEARSVVAFIGGGSALLLVLVLARNRNYDPVTMILCGLVVSLVCGALSATLILAGGDYMLSLYLWGGGALAQTGWRNDAVLIGLLVAAGLAAFLLRRPLALLGLSDETAKSLGVSTAAIRLAAVLVATILATTVTAFAGIIGFVGLMAANLARLSGARTPGTLLLAAPLVGAVLLFATDAVVLAIEAVAGTTVATGAVTALVGGPLLLWLLPRLPQRATVPMAVSFRRLAQPRAMLLWLAVLTFVAALVSLLLMPDGAGVLTDPAAIAALMPLRWPRLLAGASAGAMLAVAGVVLQRFTANPIASPEVLGISSGAGLGLAVLLVAVPFAGTGAMLLATGAGSLAALAAILVFARAARLGPERLLLGGIAVASLAGAGVTLVMARGGPEASRLLDWMSGSTLRVTSSLALAEAALAVLLLPLAVLAHRWLAVLSLGGVTSRSLGLSPTRAGGLLVTLAAILTAAATLAVGPLSFVGLMAPHLARSIGFARPKEQLFGAALLGAAIMIATDTAARSLAFPYQLPTGLFAALVGGPYLVAMLLRKPR